MKATEKPIVKIVTVDTILSQESFGLVPETFERTRTLTHAEDEEIAKLIIENDKEHFKKHKPSYIANREYKTEKAYIWTKEKER